MLVLPDSIYRTGLNAKINQNGLAPNERHSTCVWSIVLEINEFRTKLNLSWCNSYLGLDIVLYPASLSILQFF